MSIELMFQWACSLLLLNMHDCSIRMEEMANRSMVRQAMEVAELNANIDRVDFERKLLGKDETLNPQLEKATARHRATMTTKMDWDRFVSDD
jgi:hypothetical protein